MLKQAKGKLILENGLTLEGELHGFKTSIAGEVVFNTGMTGYPETFTDPSYCGQILVLTYPLIGNYGVPGFMNSLIQNYFESDRVHISGLVISELSNDFSHWNSVENLSSWLEKFKVPILSGIDTRMLTKILREKGTMPGKIIYKHDVDFYNPDKDDLISKVCISEVQKIGNGSKKILLIDCGCKNSILKNLLKFDTTVFKIPWYADYSTLEFDGILFSNGPGNPAVYKKLIARAKTLLSLKKPTLGICLGHQIIASASGAKTYKLKYGHRSQNQPVNLTGTNKCFVTSQNHSFAVDEKSLSNDWLPYFNNLNDGTNEGIKHKELPFLSVQFHPEAAPGPVDTSFIFEEFLKEIK